MSDCGWSDARRVLVVRLDNLGDVLVTTPAVRALRHALPGAKLTLLASKVGAQVGRLNPDIDDVIVYQAPWMDPWSTLPQDSAREQEMIATIKERCFDGAVIFTSFRQSALPAAYLCYLADIPLRVAASVDGPGSLLTTRHKHPDKMMHEVERGLDLVASIGIPGSATASPTDLDLVLSVPEGAREVAGDIVASVSRGGVRPVVVVHPGCTMPARTYPWEMYVQVIDELVERLDALVLLTGTDVERELVRRIWDGLLPHSRRASYLCAGTLSFEIFCAIIERADVTITNNTGPMHISAATKTPVVALFALTNPPEQWGPWRVPHRLLYHETPCRICYNRACPFTHDCLRLVTPTMVVSAADELLARPATEHGQHGRCELRGASPARELSMLGARPAVSSGSGLGVAFPARGDRP